MQVKSCAWMWPEYFVSCGAKDLRHSPHPEDAEVCVSAFHFISEYNKAEEQSPSSILPKLKGYHQDCFWLQLVLLDVFLKILV